MYTFYVIVYENDQYVLYEHNGIDNEIVSQQILTDDEIVIALEIYDIIADFTSHKSLLSIRTRYGTMQKTDRGIRIYTTLYIPSLILTAFMFDASWSIWPSWFELDVE